MHGPAWHICVADVDMMGIFYHEYADMLLVRDERWRKAYVLLSVVYEVGTKNKRKKIHVFKEHFVYGSIMLQ